MLAGILTLVLTAVRNLPVGLNVTPTPSPADYLIPPTTKVIVAALLVASLTAVSNLPARARRPTGTAAHQLRASPRTR